MTRLWLLLAIFLAGWEGLRAQETVKTNVCGVQLGLAVPCSSFAKKTFDYSKPGFAGTGVSLEADYFWFPGRFLGFSLSLGCARIPFDAEAYEKSYGEILPGQQVLVEAGAYQLFAGTLGLICRTPRKYRTEFMFVPWYGYSASRHPELTATSDLYGVINSVEKSWDLKFIVGFTLLAGYDVTDRLGLNLSYRRNALNPEFPDRTSLDGEFRLPVKYWSLSLGVHFNLQ